MQAETLDPASNPSLLHWSLGFILVGIAWGFTTPFIRKAAVDLNPAPRPILTDPNTNVITRKILSVFYTLIDLLSRPGYAVPLILNLTGSIWFFLLIGQAELSLTVPITNSLAFLFTVLGEWCAEGKVIARNTWIGMALVLLGIGLCVQSKNISS